jgi:hypothetical protein
MKLKTDKPSIVAPSNKVSMEIYKAFQRKYLLGGLAVLEATCVASLYLKNIKPFSLVVVSPSGSMKSSLLSDIYNVFEKYAFQIESRFTPYGLSSMPDKHLLDNKTWMINDMVRTFDTLNPTKAQELVGWLAELMTEGHAGSATAKEAILTARMNLIGNIALVKYKEVKKYFISSTFAERVVQYFYTIEKDKIRSHNCSPNIPISISLPEFEMKEVTIPSTYKKIVYMLSNNLQVLQQYDKESVRTDEITKSILCAHALLNGRTKINKTDVNFLLALFPNLKRVV